MKTHENQRQGPGGESLSPQKETNPQGVGLNWSQTSRIWNLNKTTHFVMLCLECKPASKYKQPEQK